MMGVSPARSAIPGPREVSGAPSPSGEFIEPGGRAWCLICPFRRYHLTKSIARRRTTARPAAPPTTPPAIVPAGGVLLLLSPPLSLLDEVVLAVVAGYVGVPWPAVPAIPTVAIAVTVLISISDDAALDEVSEDSVALIVEVVDKLELDRVDNAEMAGILKTSPSWNVVVNEPV